MFSAYPDFEKTGARPEQKTLVLHFDFPEKAYTGYAPLIEQLSRETGWAVELSPKLSHPAVQRAVHDALPLSWDVSKISIFSTGPKVRVRVRPIPGDDLDQVAAAARERFFELTGKTLELDLIPEMSPPQKLFDELGRMEHNAAYTRLRNRLAERGVALLSFGKKGDPPFLELGLITPIVTERHQGFLEELSREVGWSLKLRTGVNGAALATRVRQLLPLEHHMRGEPSLLERERLVRVEASRMPDPAMLAELSSQLERETGFALAVVASTRKQLQPA